MLYIGTKSGGVMKMKGSRVKLMKKMRSFRFLLYYDETKEERYLGYKLEHPQFSWEKVFIYVGIGLDHDFYTKVCQIKYPDTVKVYVNKYRQLPRNFVPADLEAISSQYSDGELFLCNLARIAFENMCHEAEKEGLELKAVSTYRSFYYQNQVYYKNYSEGVPLILYQQERDQVSARAGHSEHQTGLAVDINELEPDFENTKEGMWLSSNSYKYGFVLRYPKGKEAITGYAYEPWHFRYLGTSLARNCYQSGLTYDEFYIRYAAII